MTILEMLKAMGEKKVSGMQVSGAEVAATVEKLEKDLEAAKTELAKVRAEAAAVKAEAELRETIKNEAKAAAEAIGFNGDLDKIVGEAKSVAEAYKSIISAHADLVKKGGDSFKGSSSDPVGGSGADAKGQELDAPKNMSEALSTVRAEGLKGRAAVNAIHERWPSLK